MLRQIVRYGLVGLANTVIGLAFIYLAMGVFGFAPGVANFSGFAIAFLVSFFLNRRWTFESNAHFGQSFFAFASVCAAGYGLNLAAVLTAINLADVNAYIAQLIGVAIYAVFVFIGSRVFAFRT
ncbi:MAG: GtrA family protein [Pseudomonadota bacterium]